jgi:hypothetical protein
MSRGRDAGVIARQEEAYVVRQVHIGGEHSDLSEGRSRWLMLQASVVQPDDLWAIRTRWWSLLEILAL